MPTTRIRSVLCYIVSQTLACMDLHVLRQALSTLVVSTCATCMPFGKNICMSPNVQSCTLYLFPLSLSSWVPAVSGGGTPYVRHFGSAKICFYGVWLDIYYHQNPYMDQAMSSFDHWGGTKHIYGHMCSLCACIFACLLVFTCFLFFRCIKKLRSSSSIHPLSFSSQWGRWNKGWKYRKQIRKMQGR